MSHLTAAGTFDPDATDGVQSVVVTEYSWLGKTTRTAQKFRADLDGENGHRDDDYAPPPHKISSSPVAGPAVSSSSPSPLPRRSQCKQPRRAATRRRLRQNDSEVSDDGDGDDDDDDDDDDDGDV